MQNNTPIVDQLFFNRYWVFVEERAFYSEEVLSDIGYVGAFSEEEALENLGKLREVRVNIPTLAKYYSDGYKLKMSNVKDCSEIFRIINTHLSNWLSVCNLYGYVTPMPPIEDFELLDRLAEKMFPYRRTISIADRLNPLFKDEVTIHNLINVQGMYEPYAPKLYPYCKQVYGDE